jgi:prepilin-type N-terminal cleavage/methylation domain-containing protein
MKTRCAVGGARLPPRGFTLVEVVVVVAILGMIAGMSGLAFVTLRTPGESELVRELRGARAEAIATGRPVITGSNHAPRTAHVLFLPDGRAIGPGADPLTGVPVDSAR